MRASRSLRRGLLIAHHTATLPGVAATPNHRASVEMLQQFKQRRGPFLLLADSTATALSLARVITPGLRRQAKACWPGPVTLVFAARPGLPACCYQQGHVAVRVDARLQVRQLAGSCGGLILSSSLNRRGGAATDPERRAAMRLHRWIARSLAAEPGSGTASTMMRLRRDAVATIRR